MSPASGRPVVLVASLDSALPRILEAAGYATLYSTSGMEARRLAIHTQPDLALIAPVLSDMSGTDACRLLRADPAVPRHLPILILFDGPPTPELRVAALRVGAWDFVSPSADREELLLRLASQLEAQRGVREAVDEGLLDPTAGFFSQPGLARRARMFSALMTRVRGPFACLAVELLHQPDLRGIGSVVARTVRISDVVGELGGPRLAVLAPGTDEAGTIHLAERIADAVVATSSTFEIGVGFEVVTNAKYAPIEPYPMLRRAVAAIHAGQSIATHRWIRRVADPAPTLRSDSSLAGSVPTAVHPPL